MSAVGRRRVSQPILVIGAFAALFAACVTCTAVVWLAAGVLAERAATDGGTVTVAEVLGVGSDESDRSEADVRAGSPEVPSSDGALRGSSPSTDRPGSAGEPLRGGTLYLPGVEPLTLDPALVQDVVSAEYVYEIFSGLVTLSPELEVVPDLASSWEQSPDGTVYTFTLRTDARFHDGRPVTARDIAFAIERACDPATGSPVAETYLGDIVGCGSKLQGLSPAVEGVRVLGDHELSLTIDAPKAYFLAKLTYPTSFALDRLQVEADGEWDRRPNGSGPFKLTEFAEDDRIVLERNDDYYGHVPWLDAVYYDLRPIAALTRYENGELDAAPVGASDLERVNDELNPLSLEVVEGPGGLSVTYIGFNTTKPPFDDVHLRRAFNYALDRERLAEVVLRGAGQPVAGVLPPGMPGYRPDTSPYTFDPETARAELALSRYGSADGVPPITINTAGEAGASPVAEAVADFIGETLGVTITVEQAPWQLFQQELDDGRYQAFMLGWAADYPDPQDFLDMLLHSESPLNDTGYGDPKVDRILEEARTESDEDRRFELYNQAERLLLEDAPWLPLFSGVDTWLVAPYVKGFEIPAIVRPRMAEVWLDER